LPPGSGHDTYLYAFSELVCPHVKAFKPDLIIVSSGLDANAVDPLSRMLLHSDSYRELTSTVIKQAEELCEGRLVIIHEGGYSEAYVPFCGLAVVEALSGFRSDASDPALSIFKAWQPRERFNAFARSLIDEYVSVLEP
jgi:acetoin utilization deacetylase AcuC-like enzyme